MNELLTTKQIQDLLQVDRITVYRMLNDGRLKGVKIGNQWRFPQSEIDRLTGEESDVSNLENKLPMFQISLQIVFMRCKISLLEYWELEP